MVQNNNKYNNVILHVPHTNAKFPDDMGELLGDLDTIISFFNQISDLGINELFSHNIGVKYVAPFSRIYCYVEKYIDDDNEVMSKYGQGVFYTKDRKGKVFRRIDQEYKDRIADSYYFPYHKGLDELMLTLSLLDKRLIIVDCHSYGEECVQHNKSDSYTDICIGYDEQYYSKKLVDDIGDIFVENGYSVSYSTPYEGTLIPNTIYNKNIPGVFCIMIEINKRVYKLNEQLTKSARLQLKPS